MTAKACAVIPDRVDVVTPAPAVALVVSVGEAKVHARVTHGNEDRSIEGFVRGATNRVQQRTDRQLIEATFRAILPCFPDGDIELRPAPLNALVSIKYRDVAGIEQTLLEADPDPVFLVVKPAGPTCPAGRIVLKDGREWPETAEHPEAVKIEFKSGYGTGAAAVPDHLVDAIKAGTSELHNFREKPDLDGAIDPFIMDFVLWR